MIIKVSDSRIGTFTWELPPDLAEKWTLKTAEMPEGAEKRLIKFIEENITDLLIVICDALEFTPATPALLDALFYNLDNLMSDANGIVLIMENMDKILRVIKDKKEKDKEEKSDSPDEGLADEDKDENPDDEEFDEYLDEDEDGDELPRDDDKQDDEDDPSPKGDNPA